jgi:hypothetical protein
MPKVLLPLKCSPVSELFAIYVPRFTCLSKLLTRTRKREGIVTKSRTTVTMYSKEEDHRAEGHKARAHRAEGQGVGVGLA